MQKQLKFGMDKTAFENLVKQALDLLPENLAELISNIDVVVQDYPSQHQLRESGLEKDNMLLGLYEGIPITERGQFYDLVPPDKITIFQKPIENKCFYSHFEITQEINKVVRHEIAHHFGISDSRLEELENK